jgi:hypothetical protein
VRALLILQMQPSKKENLLWRKLHDPTFLWKMSSGTLFIWRKNFT